MNQGRIWCVVSPTVGLPLLLGSVCVTSLIVHTAVLTHTTWYGNLYEGKARAVSLNDSATHTAALASKSPAAFTISVAPVAGAPGTSQTAFLVTVAPNAASTALASNTPAAPAVNKVVALK